MSRRSDEVERQPRVSLGVRTVYLPLVILLALCPRVGAQQIQLTIGTASGPPGGTAGVPFSLTDPTNAAVGAGVFVLFPGGTQDALSIDPPNDCTIAQRLASTHILAAVRLNEPPGEQGFDLEVAPNPNAPGSPNLPIGTGAMASCTFHVPATAQLGSTTTLTANSVLVSDANAQTLPATGVNGEVRVALVTPTPTATVTRTPVPPTNTPTSTTAPTNAPTRTFTTALTATPTAPRTNTPGSPTPTKTVQSGGNGGGGGCTIAAPNSADVSPLAWLVVPAAALLWRRRARR